MVDQIGTIAPSKQADLVLVDRDVMTVPAEELKETKVLWTMFGGKMVYRAESGVEDQAGFPRGLARGTEQVVGRRADRALDRWPPPGEAKN